MSEQQEAVERGKEPPPGEAVADAPAAAARERRRPVGAKGRPDMHDAMRREGVEW